MKQLSHSLILSNEELKHQSEPAAELPEKILQIGEGNFIRGFNDWMVEQMNRQGIFNGRVIAVQPTPHGRKMPDVKAQNGAYTVVLRGTEQGTSVDRADLITAISRGINPYEEWNELVQAACQPDVQIMMSNTTEAGLTYQPEDWSREKAALSFPGKLTQLLYERFLAYDGDPDKGWTLLPCELVERNGDVLKELVLRKINDWKLGEAFETWILESNEFCQTLVDRIVTGYPDNAEEFEERLGYKDKLLTVAEPFHLFVIEGSSRVKDILPLDQAGLNVRFASVSDFAELKIRLLNAPHTMIFALSYLNGIDTVYETMKNQSMRSFLDDVMDEAIKPLLAFPEEEKDNFSSAVLERFENPFQRHFLTDLGQNGMQKFKSRVLPLWERIEGDDNSASHYFAAALAGLLAYYQPAEISGDKAEGRAFGRKIPLRETEESLTYIAGQWKEYKEGSISIITFTENLLSREELWENKAGFLKKKTSETAAYLQALIENDVEEALQLLKENTRRTNNEPAK
ncbi:tagaturonate reductase [Alteribacillus sp. HJP-4]|uniref:tagaturonate reductase n=1 Tax=Alteribacillus sp. HJP-4 TaxID=2775394 RepID=UPI0035CCEA69